MLDTIFYFVMVPMVYLAIVWSIVGIIAKMVSIARAPKHPHILKLFPERKAPGLAAVVESFSMPTVRRKDPVFWVFLMLFHVAFIVLFVAHLDLLPQINIMDENSPHMIGNGAVGVAVTISVLYFLWRRFKSPVREISVPADYLMLILLFMIFITGDVISWSNSWNEDGFVIEKLDFGVYLNGLVHFTGENPSETLYGSHYVVVVVHVLLANLFLMLLPFSKIMHTFFAVGLNKFRRAL